MFEHFVELQERIFAMTVRGEALLNQPDIRDTAALGQGRWEIARTLREYQLYKHSVIFDPIEREGGHRGRAAQRMKADCVRVGEEFRKYVLRWSVMSLIDHWEEYRPAALESIARIRAQLVKERAGVAELLDMKLAA